MNSAVWEAFLRDCRGQVPKLCPECGDPVMRDDPFCEEGLDAHVWLQATYYCDGPEDCSDECDWSVTFERLVQIDRRFRVDHGPGVVHI